MSNPHQPGRPRTSLIDGGWDAIPNVIPDDTVVDPTVDSKELTSPDPSRRPDELDAKARAFGPSALGLPPAAARPSTPPPKPARPSGPPPPPSARSSTPPSAPLRPSAPPPPSQRASKPPPRQSQSPGRPSTPPGRPSGPSSRPSRPPGPAPAPAPAPERAPPPAMVDTLSESIDAIIAEPSRFADPSPPANAAQLPSSSLAPTQPSPRTVEPSGPTSEWPGPASTRVPEEIPTLVEALAQRVRVAGGAGPLWGFALIGVALSLGAMALLSGSCSALLARTTVSPPPATNPVAKPSAPALASVAPPSNSEARPPEPALIDVAAIEARPVPERSVDDVIALSRARGDEKRRALDGAASPSAPDLASTLKSAAQDPETMRDALARMAKTAAPIGPDLLYSTWTSRRKNDPAAVLAEELIATHEVRRRASPALLVALDLRAATSCDAAKDALTRAAEHGDRRSAPLIGRFTRKRGCGDAKRDDCFPCLRAGDEIKTAVKAVAARPAPKL